MNASRAKNSKKKFDQASENFEKSPGHEIMIPEKSQLIRLKFLKN